MVFIIGKARFDVNKPLVKSTKNLELGLAITYFHN
jgi:hypothetical protein